jgi:hypothetical protein
MSLGDDPNRKGGDHRAAREHQVPPPVGIRLKDIDVHSEQTLAQVNFAFVQ